MLFYIKKHIENSIFWKIYYNADFKYCTSSCHIVSSAEGLKATILVYDFSITRPLYKVQAYIEKGTIIYTCIHYSLKWFSWSL
jgi:hypothetical protein